GSPRRRNVGVGSGLVYIPRDSKTSKVQQWNIGAQRELTSDTSAMLAYVGTRGDNLATVVTSAGFGGAVADRLTTIMFIGSSKYDSLQASLRRREANGLSHLASYTDGDAPHPGAGFFPRKPSTRGPVSAT